MKNRNKKNQDCSNLIPYNMVHIPLNTCMNTFNILLRILLVFMQGEVGCKTEGTIVSRFLSFLFFF